MSLKEQIADDMKAAMREKRKQDLTALRSIKSMIMLAETEEGASGELTAEQELKLLTKAAKQRQDSARTYQEQNREDLAEVELQELKVIQQYLPKPLTEEEIIAEVKSIIADVGASSMKDMGKVMGVASKKLAGKADGRVISEKVKALLG